LNDIYLTSADIKKLENKKMNQGTDGTIYRIGNGLLYKIYHNSTPIENVVLNLFPKIDEEGVKIYEKGLLKTLISRPSTLDVDYVKLRAEDAIKLAKMKQKYVKLTTLPLASLYIDNKFKGCVLKDFPHSTSIYNIRYFPLSIRLRIARQVLERTKELLKNNIYRIDLGGKPINKSNVLLNYFPYFAPEIIDNDGRSAVYTEKYVKELYNISIQSLNSIIIEILCYRTLEPLTELDKVQAELDLEEIQVPSIYMESLINQTASLDELEDCLRRMQKSNKFHF